MQSRKTSRALCQELPNGDHDTISCTGPALDRLIAASAEVEVPTHQSRTALLAAPPAEVSVESTIAYDSSELALLGELPVESTVVIAGSRPMLRSVRRSGVLSVPNQPLGQLRSGRQRSMRSMRSMPSLPSLPSTPRTPSMPSLSSVGPVAAELPSSRPPAMSYSVTTPPPPEEAPPSILGKRIVFAIFIATVGMLCGATGATSLLRMNHAGPASAGAGAATPGRVEPRTSFDERLSRATVLRYKASSHAPVKGRQH